MGYIYEDGKMMPVSRVNLPLWQHGENGHPPSDYAFSFVAGKSLRTYGTAPAVSRSMLNFDMVDNFYSRLI